MEKLTQYSREPKERRLRGCRDLEVVDFVGRYGVVAIEHVMTRLAIGRATAYRLVAVCIEQGLLERLDLLRAQPSLLRATTKGIREVGLGMPLARVSVGAVEHWLRCASTGLLLSDEHGPELVMSERELALAELWERTGLVSARRARHPNERPRLHRPDFVVLTEAGNIAVEVELTPKAPRRLEAIMRGWRRATWVSEVHYHCEPGPTRRAVERAIERTHATERVRVFKAVAR